MFAKFLKDLFGSKNERELKQVTHLVDEINTIEPNFQALSDDQLRAKTFEFKEKISRGEPIDDLLVEAFAIVREASVRVLNMRHFDVQLIGGIFLHKGKIAEMKTGEGKTLAATLPLYLNALSGKGVHLVTVNDYLARRDAEWMGAIYNFLSLSVGVIVHGMDDQERKKAYNCDITYGTNNEFGFDYLRDNMKFDANDLVQRGFHYAIVDEVDSILIDEARTPLIISGPVEKSEDENRIFMEVKPLVIKLKNKQSLIINSLLEDLKNRLQNDDTDDKTIEILLQIRRGDPKNQHYLKILAEKQHLKKHIDKLSGMLSAQKMLPELDEILYCTIDERANSVELTEKGLQMVSTGDMGDFILPDLDDISHSIREDNQLTAQEKDKRLQELEIQYIRTSDLLHATQQLIKSYWLFEKDVHYVVKEGQIVIVDEFTGRMMPGRRWSDGLHQAVEAKEGIKIAGENQTLSTITFQNYFRMYDKLAGMTGTADTEAGEFHNIYNLEVVVIPTNKDMIRDDFSDVIYKSEKEKFKAAARAIKELYQKGQPVLVGTISIEKSEMLSNMLKKDGVPHSVLNAKHHQKEAEIIANAGQKKVVTISTNMAGRGTDIVLGEGVRESGGLHILGTERHESRRVDNQLRGRAGRQGDPGSSRFYLSLEDDLLRIFGSDRISSIMSRLGMDEDEPIEHNLISRGIENAQKKVEGHNFDIRKHLLEYDDVMNKHREIIYSFRKEVLSSREINEIIENMIDDRTEILVENMIDPKAYPEDWDLKGLNDSIARIFGTRLRIGEQDVDGIPFDDLKVETLLNLIQKQAKDSYKDKQKLFGKEDFEGIATFFILQIIDNQWIKHLQNMEHMKEGIGLRGYGQLDPLKEYQKEGFALFEELMEQIKDESLSSLFRLHLLKRHTDNTPKKDKELNLSHGGDSPREPIKRDKQKIGRNSPCPCGSGKKYKKCCGAN